MDMKSKVAENKEKLKHMQMRKAQARMVIKKRDQFESTVQELVDKHGDKYTEAQLRVAKACYKWFTYGH